MESYILNDVEYDFKPLEIFVPDANYKVDKKELEKSKGKPEKVFAEDMIFPKRGILKLTVCDTSYFFLHHLVTGNYTWKRTKVRIYICTNERDCDMIIHDYGKLVLLSII